MLSRSDMESVFDTLVSAKFHGSSSADAPFANSRVTNVPMSKKFGSPLVSGMTRTREPRQRCF